MIREDGEKDNNMKREQKGFTLLELMIVMIIMGILAAIGVTAFISSQIKGRDTARKGDLKSITTALELYYNDVGSYPLDNSAGGIKGCNGPPAATCTVNTVWQDANATVYMPELPTDPVSTQKYYYVDVNGKQFQLYTHLENSQDPQLITPAAAGTSCGTGVSCNYGVSSANTTP